MTGWHMIQLGSCWVQVGEIAGVAPKLFDGGSRIILKSGASMDTTLDVETVMVTIETHLQAMTA